MPKHFEKAIFSQFSAKFGPFLHPQMTRNFQKRRDVVETQLNQPRGTQNNHFLDQIPKSLTTPPPLPLLGHCGLQLYI